jgi:cyclopropane fatty-acyl-phospholipid synthase-like methyltransferase
MTDFNQAASGWDEHIDRRKRSEEIADAILAHASLTAEMDLVEFGAGTGVLGLALRPHVGSVTAADAAQGMLDVVEGKIKENNLGNMHTLLIRGDAGDAFPACDAIVSSMTLHHIEDLPSLLGRFFSALRQDGVLALADLDPDGGLFHPDHEGVFHQGFEHSGLKKWIEGAGFEQVVFYPATSMRKIALDGVEREFSIFLVVARKLARA